MPIYEYRCSECGERFEKLVRTTSGPVEVHCPNCDAVKVERQVSLFGFAAGASVGSSFGSAPSCGPVGG